MPATDAPASRPDLEACRPALEFFVRGLREGWAGASDGELAAHTVVAPPSIEARRTPSPRFRFGTLDALDGFEPAAAGWVVAWRDVEGRAWRTIVLFEDRPPHRIRAFGIPYRPMPPGFRLRPATAEDAPALAALEHRAPIRAGDVRVVYDHGDDYFAQIRLMGTAEVMVLERTIDAAHQPEVVGVQCWSIRTVRVDDAVYRLGTIYRLRFDPSIEGAGLFGALNGAMGERTLGRVEATAGYAARDNQAAARLLPPHWSILSERIVIDTAAHVGPEAGRRATVEDAPRLVDLMNACHDREALYLPYTEAALTERLTREPDAYTWSNVLLGERALVGVWPAGIRVHRTDAPEGVTTEDTRALVLDYACLPGAEAELVSLLEASCARLAVEGATELALFTAPGSPARDALLPLAKRVEPYWLGLPIPEPLDLATRGLYTDHLYF